MIIKIFPLAWIEDCLIGGQYKLNYITVKPLYPVEGNVLFRLIFRDRFDNKLYQWRYIANYKFGTYYIKTDSNECVCEEVEERNTYVVDYFIKESEDD